jgi:mono/diheme cytochrome c family protein
MKMKSKYNQLMFRSLVVSLALVVFTGIDALGTTLLFQAQEAASTFWLWKFFGRLHPLAVHFPVSLLLFAALLELFTLKNFNHKLRPGISVLVWAGATGALIAAVLGLLLANVEDYGGSLLDLHQWTGIGTGVLGVLLVYLLGRIKSTKNVQAIKVFRVTLFSTALAVSVAGHFGASLTHGEEYLTETLPWNEPEFSPEDLDIDLVAFETEGALSEQKQIELVGKVRAVFAHNCYKCHSDAKIKGELRLDEKEFAFQGGESGAVIVPGDPGGSELVRRIKLPKDHKEAMPSKGQVLSNDEIALISFWIDKGAPWPDAAEDVSVYRVAELAPRRPDLPAPRKDLNQAIDIWVDEYFQEKDIDWKAPVDDKVYLRRVYLDILGLQPTTEEYAAFIQDSRPDKRAILVKELLDRDDDYATHWITFWNDALRNDYTGTGYITKGRYAITDWLYTSLRDNKPYDKFVRQLLNPDEKSKGFIEGIRWRGDVNASQVTEMQAAQNVGQVILGLNLKCASCHDSFISDWKLEEAYAFANIFADSTLAINRCDKPTGEMADTRILWEELGEMDGSGTREEKLEQLANYLVQPANGRLYRTVVNRIWKQMMGRGIVEPADEMDNIPWSQDLLDWLATDFEDEGYNLKQLIYKIAISKAYQQPAVGVENPRFLVDDDFVFEGSVVRRMTAEQFTDGVSQKIHPIFEEEQMKYDPYQLAVAEETNIGFVRASLVANNSLLKALGRTNREVVMTSRDSQASLLQALELTNGEQLNNTLKEGAVKWKEKYRAGDIIVHEVYRQLLGRDPQQSEYKVALAALGEDPEPEAIQDLFWAVLLLPEFQLIY